MPGLCLGNPLFVVGGLTAHANGSSWRGAGHPSFRNDFAPDVTSLARAAQVSTPTPGDRMDDNVGGPHDVNAQLLCSAAP